MVGADHARNAGFDKKHLQQTLPDPQKYPHLLNEAVQQGHALAVEKVPLHISPVARL